MNPTKLLTIAIPTYNQVIEFERTILSVIDQISLYPDIEILVRDDSTSNDTQLFVKNLNNSQIRYFKGEKQSLDHADFWLMDAAYGEYVWWFGDDIFLPNAIANILNILNSNPDFVWINSASESKTKNLGKSRYMTGAEVIENIGDLLTFISALLWKRSFLLPHLKLGEKYLGNCMAYMYPQLQALSLGGRYYYCDEVLFYSRARSFDKLWYNPLVVFGKNYLDALNAFTHVEELHLVLKKERKRRSIEIIKGVLYYKINNNEFGLGASKIYDVFAIFIIYPSTWMYLLMLMFPSKILQIIYKIHRGLV